MLEYVYKADKVKCRNVQVLTVDEWTDGNKALAYTHRLARASHDTRIQSKHARIS